MDVFDRMLELARQGFFCAQIIMALALEAEGKEDPDLLRAMGGLSEGVGHSGGACGALTGGCCLISYFAGKGEPDEIEHEAYREMQRELITWFEAYTAAYGGSACACILDGDPKNRMQRCPVVVRDVFEKCIEILSARGIV